MMYSSLAPNRVSHGNTVGSRRRAIALLLSGAVLRPETLAGSESGTPLRFGISQSIMGDVNLNDARAAMQIWIQRMTRELNLVMDTQLFLTAQDIHDRAKKGLLDAIAMNVVEYRPIADLMDSDHIVTSGGPYGLEQYVILARRNGGIRHVADLKGRRLLILNAPRMCLASAWLSTLMDDGRHGPAEQFFSATPSKTRISHVVLPVFFGQADACLSSRHGFDMMCELNPQVSQTLAVIARSPTMIVRFYVFRRNYQDRVRDKFISALSHLRASPSGEQLSMLFQFDELLVRDSSCLTSALGILESADRAHGRITPGGLKE